MYLFFYEVRPGDDGHDSGGREKYIQQATSGREFLRKFEFANKHIQSFFETGYSYLATMHTALKSRGAEMLWTMDNLKKLCTSVVDSLSSDESTTCDKSENDISGYFPMAYHEVRGTQTCLLAEAIQFHAEHGTEQVPSEEILEEAIDDINDCSTQRNQRGRKRKHHETVDNKVDVERSTKRMAIQQKTGGRRRMYALRPRWPEHGSFTSSQGSRRSARLALRGPRRV